MVPTAGLEPATGWVETNYAIQLRHVGMEKVTRIELALTAWKAVVLPLDDTFMVGGRRLELRSCGYKPHALTSYAILPHLVGVAGVEPAILSATDFKSVLYANSSTPPIRIVACEAGETRTHALGITYHYYFRSHLTMFVVWTLS